MKKKHLLNLIGALESPAFLLTFEKIREKSNSIL